MTKRSITFSFLDARVIKEKYQKANITFRSDIHFDYSCASERSLLDGSLSSMKSAAAAFCRRHDFLRIARDIRNRRSCPEESIGRGDVYGSATDGRRSQSDPRDEQARGQASWEMPRERARRTRIRHGLWGTARHPAFRPGLGFYSSGFYTGRFLSTSLNRSNSVWLPFPAREKCETSETVISSFLAYCCDIKKTHEKSLKFFQLFAHNPQLHNS